MRFGFSYVGLIYLFLLFLPNLLWAKHKPKDYEAYVGRERKIFVILERAGEVLTTTLVLCFADFNLRPWTPWGLWLLLSFALMGLYELYWIRYFKSEQTMADQYRPFLCFPLAGASLPVLSFFLLGIYGVNVYLMIAACILGIGHIGIHLEHEREAKELERKPHARREGENHMALYTSPVEEKSGKPEKTRKRPLWKRILKGVGAFLLSLILLTLSISIGARDMRFIRHWGNYIGGAEEEAYIPLGGQEQYCLMMGREEENPVIIYLHGGPGGADTMVMYTFAEKLMDDYTLVGWDQRGCGKTYYQNQAKDPDNNSVTFTQALSDLDELVDYTRSRFHQEKVILMGHSYGTILGREYVLTHPEKVSAYISIGQVVSMERGEEASYLDALDKARDAGDDTSEMERRHEIYQAEGSLTNMLSLREEVSRYHKASKEENAIWEGISSPYFGTLDLRWFFKQVFSLQDYLYLNRQLFDYVITYDAFQEGMDYTVPVHFISGSEDWICPTLLIQEYMEAIEAPEKDLTLLEGCGHAPHSADPDAFARVVKGLLGSKQ